MYAYNVGIEHSKLLAGLSVLMALGLEGVKPLAISGALQALASFSVLRALCLAFLGLIAVAYSLTSELSLMATSKGDLVAQRQAVSDKAKIASERRDAIKLELAELGVTRPSAAVSGELNAVLSDKRLNGCTGWLESVRLRQTCIETVAPLKDELAKAERREALQTELNGLQTISSTSKTADPGSTALATYLATLGIVIPVAVLSQWLTLIPVLALEAGSALSILVVQALPKREPVQPTTSEPSIPKVRQEETSRDKAAEAIVNQLRANGGSLSRSERGLAKLIGADRSTVRRAIHGLALAGLVTVEAASRAGTVIRLAT